MKLKENLFGENFFSSHTCVVYSSILLKQEYTTKVLPHRFCQIAVLKISEKLVMFLTKLQTSLGCNFTENDAIEKNIEN